MGILSTDAFGYNQTDDRTTGTKRLKGHLFRVLTTPADGRQFSYAQYEAGNFVQDYEYVNGLGDLDEHNGRFVKHPSIPMELMHIS